MAARAMAAYAKWLENGSDEGRCELAILRILGLRGPKDDLDAAEKLINECDYHRRDEELADAKAAAKNW